MTNKNNRFLALFCLTTVLAAGLLGAEFWFNNAAGSVSANPSKNITKRVKNLDQYIEYVVAPPANIHLYWDAAAAKKASLPVKKSVTETDLDPKPFLTIRALKNWLIEQGLQPSAIMNAGIYDTDYKPLGLHIDVYSRLPVNRARGYGNFYLQPNGMFVIDHKEQAKVIATAEFTDGKGFRLATQSGPLLVQDNQLNPILIPDSVSRKIRNGIGVRADGQVVMAASIKPVNFYEFATFFKDQLACPDALYLDGTISKLWRPGQSDSQYRPFAGMLAVHE